MFGCRTLTIRASSFGHRVCNYSHGPTVGDVYQGFRKVDELLLRLRPDLMTEVKQVDELLTKGELTPTMAKYFKKEIEMSNEAKSRNNCFLFTPCRDGRILAKSVLVCRSPLDALNWC
jgi:hypothetical protein